MEGFYKKYSARCIVIAGVLWGIIGIFVRRLTSIGLGSMEQMLVRSVIAAVGLVIYLAIFDREKLKVKVKDLWMFFGTGMLSFLTFGWAYFFTMGITSVSTAAVLLYTSPVFVTVMAAIFFKERITGRKIAALVLALCGTVLVSGGFGGVKIKLLGIATGLLSGFCYALYSIFGRVAAKGYSPITVTVYTFLFSSAGCLFIADFGKTADIISREPSSILLVIAFAVVTAVIPYILYTGGLKYTSAGKAAVIACVEPVVATLTGVLVFRETMSIQALCGSLLILGAILVLNQKGQNG
ncbi:MAG: EamA family transporter [Eubacteriales bacterium]|nr:EamA family transporter [Eubacteriales bacterium]